MAIVVPSPATGLQIIGGGTPYIRHQGTWAEIGPAGPTVLEDWPGADGSPWPAQWATAAPNGGGHDIQGGEGRQFTGTGGNYTDYGRALLDDIVAADFDITGHVTVANADEKYLSFHFRSDGTWNGNDSTNNGWRVFWAAGGWWHLGRWSAGGGEVNVTGDINRTVAATTQHFRVQCVGSNVRVRLWANAEPEPSDWTHEDTGGVHSSLTRVGLTLHGGAAAASREVRWGDLTSVPVP